MNALRIFLLIFGFSLQAFGTSNGYAVNTFTCSDGVEYNAIRYVSGDSNDQGWTFVAVCKAGIVSQAAYEGEVDSITVAHQEVRSCAEQQLSDDEVNVRRCNDEFIEQNGLRGIEGQRIVGTTEGLAEVNRRAVITRSESKPTHRTHHDRQPSHGSKGKSAGMY